MEFCDKLAELRRQKGWSQETMADLLNVSRQAVGKWEAGRAMPDVPKLIAISELFDVSLDTLLKDKQPTPTTNPAAPVAVGPLVPISHLDYEYKSKTRVFGVPLVHIHYRRFGPPVMAKGIIALGNVAVGVVALGGVAVGGIALGGLSLGLLLALGGMAVGGLAFGGVAIGLLAFGGLAIGAWAMGGCALAGQVAIGGYAAAPVAVGAEVSAEAGFIIEGKVTSGSFEAFRQAVAQHAPWTPGWFIALCRGLW